VYPTVLGYGAHGTVVPAKNKLTQEWVAIKYILKSKVPRGRWCGGIPVEIYVLRRVCI